MEHCLRRVHKYMNQNPNHLLRLKHMAGLKLRVGKYLGVADDGAFIVPWDLPLASDGTN